MSETGHPPGDFCWVELTTSDSAGAKRFYSELLGWETEDDPIPGGGVYTMLRLDGGNIGGLYELNEEMKGDGMPPCWNPYVSVADAAASVAKARGLGGNVIKDAFDVFDIGSMAVLQDPTGAAFCIWQAKRHAGTEFTDRRPGTVCWNELATRDAASAGAFYTGLFDWKPELTDMPGGKYTMFRRGESHAAGMLQMTEDWGDLPSHWMVYFSVGDCDATAAKATELGGTVKVPATDIPAVGRFCVIQDPQGAVFSVIELSRRSS